MKLTELFQTYSITRKFPFWLIVAATVAAFASGILNVVAIRIAAEFLDSATRNGPSLFLGMAFFCALAVVARVFSTNVLADLAQETAKNLRLQICREVVAAPLPQVEKAKSAILSCLDGDVPVIGQMLLSIPRLCLHGGVVIASLIAIFLLNGKLLIWVVAISALGVLLYRGISSRGHRHLIKARERQDQVFASLTTVMEGLKELKLHSGRKAQALKGLSSAMEDEQEETRMGENFYNVAESSSQFLYLLMIGGALYAGVAWLGLANAQLAFFALIAFYMKSSLEVVVVFSGITKKSRIAMAAIEKIGLSLKKTAKKEDERLPREGFAAPRSIELIDASFSYSEGTEGSPAGVVGPITMRLGAGQIVILTGANGSGKTTFAKVLCGLYPPVSGKLILDGMEITDGNRAWYRQNFSAVFSDGFTFSEWLPEFPAERAQSYIQAVDLSRDVQIADARFVMSGLSTGQTKRVALVNALLEDRPFYIFDELAASQDSKSRSRFYREWLPYLKSRGKLVVAVAHDPEFFDVADCLYEFAGGKIHLSKEPV